MHLGPWLSYPSYQIYAFVGSLLQALDSPHTLPHGIVGVPLDILTLIVLFFFSFLFLFIHFLHWLSFIFCMSNCQFWYINVPRVFLSIHVPIFLYLISFYFHFNLEYPIVNTEYPSQLLYMIIQSHFLV